ncbi:hypothetical protein GLOIN_2v1791623 [Rhizophagus irregularis DAOM 181602=DAOM 197198]|nr:hypothetical protein GLOIN_2v1791623 [Rhizophagus irregularis DAOM 181602=DAOM 197198]
MEFITNNIKRLSENIPDGVDDEARNLNKKIKVKVTLERINDNEDVRNLKDITNKNIYPRLEERREMEIQTRTNLVLEDFIDLSQSFDNMETVDLENNDNVDL